MIHEFTLYIWCMQYNIHVLSFLMSNSDVTVAIMGKSAPVIVYMNILLVCGEIINLYACL